jgi:hypothetical protein
MSSLWYLKFVSYESLWYLVTNHQLIKDSAPHSLLLYAVPSQLNQTVAVMNIIIESEVY